MTYRYREEKCATCTNIVKGRYSPSRPPRCVDCGINAMMIQQLSMARKAGPAYDKWLQTNGPKGRPRTKAKE